MALNPHFDLVNGKKILVIDDDQSLLRLMKVILTRVGINVITKVDSKDAIQYFKEFSEEIELVVCDIDMPIISGIEIYNLLIEVKDKIEFLFITGYTVQEIESLYPDTKINILPKPFNKEILLSEISRILSPMEF